MINSKFNKLLDENKGVHPYDGMRYELQKGNWVPLGTPPDEVHREKMHKIHKAYDIDIYKYKDKVVAYVSEGGVQLGMFYASSIDDIKQRYPKAKLFMNGGRI